MKPPNPVQTTTKICDDLVQAIAILLDKKLIMPALMLLYSAIDTLGWIEFGGKSKSSFTKWVDAYLLPIHGSDVTSADLYGARCGLLHRGSSDSDDRTKGVARGVLYAFGPADVQSLHNLIQAINPSEGVALHISDLLDGFKAATARYLYDLANDPAHAERILERSKRCLVMMPQQIADEVVAVLRDKTPA